MTAPDQCCRNVKKLLPWRRPHVTQSGHQTVSRSGARLLDLNIGGLDYRLPKGKFSLEMLVELLGS